MMFRDAFFEIIILFQKITISQQLDIRLTWDQSVIHGCQLWSSNYVQAHYEALSSQKNNFAPDMDRSQKTVMPNMQKYSADFIISLISLQTTETDLEQGLRIQDNTLTSLEIEYQDEPISIEPNHSSVKKLKRKSNICFMF